MENGAGKQESTGDLWFEQFYQPLTSLQNNESNSGYYSD